MISVLLSGYQFPDSTRNRLTYNFSFESHRVFEYNWQSAIFEQKGESRRIMNGMFWRSSLTLTHFSRQQMACCLYISLRATAQQKQPNDDTDDWPGRRKVTRTRSKIKTNKNIYIADETNTRRVLLLRLSRTKNRPTGSIYFTAC